MKSPFSLNERASGVLLHLMSLPGPHGCGDLGAEAYRLVDFLAAAGVRWWQMLPINPPGPGNAPYSAYSAFAGSRLMVSLGQLAKERLLTPAELAPTRDLLAGRVDYPAVRVFRSALLERAFVRFEAQRGYPHADFERYRADNADWLDDYALYAVLRRRHGGRDWLAWPRELRLRRASALARAGERYRRDVAFEAFVQYEFDRQWTALRRYANERGVALLGDIPIFVAHDSADVWAHPELFQLGRDGRAKFISGTPPDMFSKTGQLWGHPQYRWSRHRADGFAWWLARFRRTFAQFDAVRIDHFIGFHRVWSVPGRDRTARRGKWVRTPGEELFRAVRRKFGRAEIIAEDLGILTPGAIALRDGCGFPGMRLLHFAFGREPRQGNAPHNFPRNCVVYPGTHDNDTTVGWFRELRAAAHKGKRKGDLSTYDRVLRYLGTDGHEIHWDLIRLALASVASLAVIPAQDLLGLDSAARMNIPATATGNWEWRLPPGALKPAIARRLRELNCAYDRVST